MKKIILLFLLSVTTNLLWAQTNPDTLIAQASRLEKQDQWAAAAALYGQAFDLMPNHQTPQAANCLHLWGRALLNSENNTEGRKRTLQAMELRKQLFGEVNEDYINSLNNYAQSFSYGEGKDLSKAIGLQQQVMQLCQKLQHPHPNIGLYTFNMGKLYFTIDDTANIIKYWEQALPLVEKHGRMYEIILEALGLIYLDQNDFPNSKRMMELTVEHNEQELKKECPDVNCLLERADMYTEMGDNVEADRHFLKALELAKSYKDRIEANKRYAKHKAMILKDYKTGAEYQLAAVKLIEDTLGHNDMYAEYINQAGLYYYFSKDYPRSIDCYQKALRHYTVLSSDAALDNAVQLWMRIGNSYSAMKDYPNAIKYLSMTVTQLEQSARTDDEQYPKALERLASAQKSNKDYDSAILNYNKALQHYKLQGNVKEYSSTMTSLELCYARAGRYDEFNSLLSKEAQDPLLQQYEADSRAESEQIIAQSKGLLDLDRQYMGHLACATTLSTIAGFYHNLDQYDSCVHYYELYMSALREGLREQFRFQNETERLILWNQHAYNIQEIYELLVSLPQGQEHLFPRLSALAYDAALLSKGILLNSSVSISKVLQENGDTRLIEIYEQSKANLREIERLRNEATTDDDLDKILDLDKKNKQLESTLYRKSSDFAHFTDYIAYTWKDVQKALKPTDVAIEFLAIKTSVIDTENYMAALILTSDATYPIALPICNLIEVKVMEQFEPLFDIDYFLWGNIHQILEGKKRIFFSADGGFHRVAVEYLKYDGAPLSEKFEVYRLSSTKAICSPRQKLTHDNAVLFGNINYFEQGINRQSAAQLAEALRTSGGRLTENTQFAELPSTKKEVEGIKKMLQQIKAKNVQLYDDTIAGKNAFLATSGSQVDILHLATHGGFDPSESATELDAMKASYLVFSGASLTDKENSIVTADEVARMNLRRCRLAVLSACETGLAISGGDGPFGLQRGFKNAGVGTLLMSLKPVHDETTAKLMLHFYRHLLVENQSPREALVGAQRDLRAEGYTDSKYWTPFILLDANFE